MTTGPDMDEYAQAGAVDAGTVRVPELAQLKTLIRDLGDMACIGCRANTCPACGLAADITNEVHVLAAHTEARHAAALAAALAEARARTLDEVERGLRHVSMPKESREDAYRIIDTLRRSPRALAARTGGTA